VKLGIELPSVGMNPESAPIQLAEQTSRYTIRHGKTRLGKGRLREGMILCAEMEDNNFSDFRKDAFWGIDQTSGSADNDVLCSAWSRGT
jgi:hypothetical protein